MKVWWGIIILMLNFGCAAADEPAVGMVQPYELLRSLQSLQDKIGIGNKAMLEARPILMNRVAENFKSVPDGMWQDIRNQRAAVLYLLNGGDRNLVRALYAKGVMVNADPALFEGALAYVSGDLEKASQAWQKLDAMRLPSLLGAHVAFAQAALCLKNNPEQALKFLDTARLLAPGTLIEEAALRRELTLLRSDENADRFLWLAEGYMERFGKSLYSDEVRKRIIRVVPALLSHEIYEERIIRLLVHLPDADAMSVYLMAAGFAVTRDHVIKADNWAGIVLAMPGVVGVEKSRALLYRAAAQVSQMNYAGARAALAESESRFFIGPDAQLLQAVQAILALNPPSAPAGVAEKPPELAAPEVLIQNVKVLLAGTDKLLTEHKPWHP